MFKNFNSKSSGASIYKNEGENTLQSIMNYQIKYPLQKSGGKFLSTLTPMMSARYSPNKSKNKAQEDRAIDVDNIFSINRIGFSDTVEGGQSITIGNEYALFDNKNINKKILSVNLATAIRDVENHKMPAKSTLGKKNSDIYYKEVKKNLSDFEFKTAVFETSAPDPGNVEITINLVLAIFTLALIFRIMCCGRLKDENDKTKGLNLKSKSILWLAILYIFR